MFLKSKSVRGGGDEVVGDAAGDEERAGVVLAGEGLEDVSAAALGDGFASWR